MNFTDPNYKIKKVRNKPVFPRYIKQYEKYLRNDEYSLAENTIRNFLSRMNTFDQWLRVNGQFRHRYNGSWEQVKRQGPILFIEQPDLENYFSHLFKLNKTLETRKAFRITITNFIKFATNKKNCNFVPNYERIHFKQTHKERHQPIKQYLTDEHIEAIRKNLYKTPGVKPRERLINLRNIAVLEILVTTGLRKSELAAIECSKIDFKNQRISVFRHKTSQMKDGWGKILFHQKSVRAAVKLYMQEFKAQNKVSKMKYLFPSLNENNASEHALPSFADAIVSAWQKWVDIPISPHMLRHYFCTKITKQFKLEIAAILIGDEIETVQKRYYHPDHDHVVDEVIGSEFTVYDYIQSNQKK